MFGKKKELEGAIEKLKSQLSEQEALNARLEQAIEEYRSKESAISHALTRAQSDAAKVLAEANAERQRILDQTEEDKAAAHAEAEMILAKAQEEAEAIRLAAKEYSRRSALKAEAFMQSYRESAKQLNMAIQRAAETAAAQAEHFRSCIKDSNLDNEIEMAGEYIQDGDNSIADLPEEYNSPAELMQNIYKIENRQTVQSAEETVTCDEECTSADEQECVLAEQPDRGPTAMLKDDAECVQSEEQPLFTVNEIVDMQNEETVQSAPDPIDEALNAIIEDVLNES